MGELNIPGGVVMDGNITINKPVFCLSKKYYAGGEVVIEFVTIDNKESSATVNLTFKDKLDSMRFELNKEYVLRFIPIEKEEAVDGTGKV